LPPSATTFESDDLDEATDAIFCNLEVYINLIDWSGRAIRADKKGSIVKLMAPLLTQIQVNPETFIDTIESYESHFKR